MKAKHYLFVAYFLGCLPLSAQTNEIQQWAEANPSVLLIENQDATTLYLENLESNNVQYIVFNQEISLSDIAEFEIMHKPTDIAALDPSAALKIKTWIANHREVKIIKRSVYDQLDASKQSMYDNLGALVLIGEEITLEDISSFE
jgi:hypothetical protein